MKHYAVIGSPITQSRSPEIYKGLFIKYGVEASFEKLEIGLSDMPRFLELIEGLDGFAVTMPLKRAVIPYLDGLDDSAAECGAVNFVLKMDGRLIGFNTDGGGLADAIGETGFQIKGKTALILGRGGAAYAAAYELEKRGGSVVLLVRSKSESPAFKECVLPELPKSADLFINASPLGMNGCPDFESFVFLDRVKPKLVFDMVYLIDEKTSLIREAERRGITAIDGSRMLERQAYRSFEIMTGIRV